MVASYPIRASSAAQASPAGPAPMMPTDFPFLGAGVNIGGIPCSKYRSIAYRCNRPISIAFSPRSLYTHAPSHRTSTGQALAHVSAIQFDSRIVFADPFTFPLAIFLINVETSMCVGHAFMHGESKQ